MKDKEKICKDCGRVFVLEAGKLEWFSNHKELSEPVRCQECIEKKKSRNNKHNT